MLLSKTDDEERLDGIEDKLRQAQVASAGLLRATAAAVVASSREAETARIDRLIQTEAWIEAALGLLEVAAPQWKLRRLVYDDGAWWCSLSRQWQVPDWLDDAAEARHEVLALAILGALIEAHRCSRAPAARATGSVPRCGMNVPARFDAICCDNFA